MVINDEKNFVPMIARMLKGLKYQNVQVIKGEPKAVDITAEKDGVKYCFGCAYAIDAIGEKKIQEFVEASRSLNCDVNVFVTNSSFLAHAKRRGEEARIELWDRNTVDRLAIGVAESLFVENEFEDNGRKDRKPKTEGRTEAPSVNIEKSVESKNKSKRILLDVIIGGVIIIAAVLIYVFYFMN